MVEDDVFFEVFEAQKAINKGDYFCFIYVKLAKPFAIYEHVRQPPSLIIYNLLVPL